MADRINKETRLFADSTLNNDALFQCLGREPQSEIEYIEEIRKFAVSEMDEVDYLIWKLHPFARSVIFDAMEKVDIDAAVDRAVERFRTEFSRGSDWVLEDEAWPKEWQNDPKRPPKRKRRPTSTSSTSKTKPATRSKSSTTSKKTTKPKSKGGK